MLNNKINKEIINLIKLNNIKLVFMDNGYFGKLALDIKKFFSDIKIISFNHGILKSPTNQQINERKGKIIYWPQVYGLLRGEQQISETADVNVVLNNRDNIAFYEAYNKYADYILPVYIENINKINREVIQSDEINILFIGGYFYPNVHGITWFIKEVLDKLHCKAKLYIVGNGMEKLQANENIGNNSNVEIIGAVENLQEWYDKSNLLIGPIFFGDGMKTKTAEALMYGKMYLGTEEALCGYTDLDWNTCYSADDFIKKIEYLATNGISSFYPEFLELYEKQYSPQMAINKLRRIIGGI